MPSAAPHVSSPGKAGAGASSTSCGVTCWRLPRPGARDRARSSPPASASFIMTLTTARLARGNRCRRLLRAATVSPQRLRPLSSARHCTRGEGSRIASTASPACRHASWKHVSASSPCLDLDDFPEPVIGTAHLDPGATATALPQSRLAPALADAIVLPRPARTKMRTSVKPFAEAHGLELRRPPCAADHERPTRRTLQRGRYRALAGIRLR